jgi:hypothetical protein
MKKFTDEEIQEWLDNGILPAGETIPPSGEEIEQYQQLYRQLAQEPPVALPADFSLKVLAALPPVKHNSNEKMVPMLLAACFIAAVVGMGGWLFGNNAEMFIPLLSVLAKYKWIAVFSIVVIVLFQYVDVRLVKRQLSSTNL